MASFDPQVGAQILRSQLDPWHTAIGNPSLAQEEVLHRVLKDFVRTDYGHQHRASNIGNLADYRQAFPIITYETIKPVIERVMAGQVRVAGEVMLKPSTIIDPKVEIIIAKGPKFVSRGGEKLEAALEAFDLDVKCVGDLHVDRAAGAPCGCADHRRRNEHRPPGHAKRPVEQQERQQPPDEAVAVHERVDALEVQDEAGDEEQSKTWRRVEAVLWEMRGPHES